MKSSHKDDSQKGGHEKIGAYVIDFLKGVQNEQYCMT